MSELQNILAANREFCKHLPGHYIEAGKQKLPRRQIAIVTCMDTRLVSFLEPALGVTRGEAKIIKTAGNSITDPFDNIVRSLLVCVYELGVEEIFIIGHEECGMAHTTSKSLIEKMLVRGVRAEAIHMVQRKLELWADEFHHPEENVAKSVDALRANPLFPADVKIHGLMFHPATGALEIIINGDLSDENA